MEITYFGEIADKTDKTSENITEIFSVNSLIYFLKEKYQLNESDYQIALNHDLVEKTEKIILNETDEIAILSPFAGG